MRASPDRPSPTRAALQTALSYAALATGWILASDLALGLLDPMAEALLRWQVLKGLGFVAVTSGLFFLLMRVHLQREQEGARRFSRLVENLPGMAYRCENDRYWTMRYVSQAAQSLTGYTPGELLDNARLAYAELIDPEDRERVWQQVQTAVSEGRPFRIEYRLRRRDGARAWIWEQGRSVPDPDHKGRMLLEGIMLDITEQKLAEATTEQTVKRLAALGDNLPGGAIYRLHRDADGAYRFTYASRGIERILGIGRERMLADAHAVFALTEPPHGAVIRETNERSAQDLSVVDMELPQRLPDGTRKWIAVRSMPYRLADGSVFWDGIVLDISERKQAEEKLREAAAVFASTAEGVAITGLDGCIRDVNQAFCDITGYRREDVIGEHPGLLQSERHDHGFYLSMYRSLRKTGKWHGEVWQRHQSGMEYPALLTISMVWDQQGRASGYVGVFTDITAIKQSEQRLDYLAHHDGLTQLPNRLLFDNRLQKSIRSAMRRNETLAVLFMDIDRFKHINDSLGHSSGDQLLQQLAQRLRAAMNSSDLVARISGDEFVVLLTSIRNADAVVSMVHRLMAPLKEPFIVDGNEVRVTTSIGISLCPDDGRSAAELLRNADAAMYQAKEEGGNTYRFYTEEMTAAAFEHVYLDNALRSALEREQFRLVYQPQVDMASGRLLGVEALLRWDHPEEGLIPPGRFIHIAEQSGLIRDIGLWVLRTACSQGRHWLDQGFAFGTLAVNVATRQIHDASFVPAIERTLADTGLPPDCLDLEISEDFVMRHVNVGAERLQRLRAQGVGIAIDDFGTGYSSLGHLKRLPINKLKIDQSFVRDIPDDHDDMAICDAVIAIGRSLGLTVIAEGVETEAQVDCLRGKGCSIAQGYLFGRPVPAEEIVRTFAATPAGID